MGTSFEYSKTLAIEGSILLLLGLVPYVGWVLGIIGVILLLRGMKEFANYYQDNEIYQNSLTGVKYYIVALIALAAAGAGFVVGFVFVGLEAGVRIGSVIGIMIGVVSLIIAFVFYVLAATHLRKTFNTLAQNSGEHSFTTAGTMLWLGSILTIIGIGVLLIFIAWLFVILGFSTMKPPQMQQYNSQPYGYTSPSTQPPAGQSQKYCSNCGAPLRPQATYCSSCGKKVEA
jgi:uncharacterized membrane protein